MLLDHQLLNVDVAELLPGSPVELPLGDLDLTDDWRGYGENL